MEKTHDSEASPAPADQNGGSMLAPLEVDREASPAEIQMDGGIDAWLAVVGCWVLMNMEVYIDEWI